MKTASASIENARISPKHSVAICSELRGKKLQYAKNFLESLIDKKISLSGKYHPTAAKQILEILESAEVNARQKGLDVEKLFIKKIKADQGFAFIRPKSRWHFRGRKAKSTTLLVELRER
jgi:large subunit ribosomal protein L22